MINYQTSLKLLEEGNKRFVEGKMEHPNQSVETLKKLYSKQTPHTVVIACSDSRVSPEVIFDQGLGDLFIIRLAGNVVDDFAIASVEYAVEHLHTPLVVVLGHECCGAVTASQGDPPENSKFLTELVKEIKPSYTSESCDVNQAIENNSEKVVEKLKKTSPIIEKLIKNDKLQVINGHFSFKTGEVTLKVPSSLKK